MSSCFSWNYKKGEAMNNPKAAVSRPVSDSQSLLETKVFLDACLDERQAKAFQRMYSRLDSAYRQWADEQYRLIEKLPKVEAVLAHTVAGTQVIEGLVCEFGVCTGTSTNLMAEALKPREVFGFDSFEGFPTDWVIGDVRVPKDMLAVDETKLRFSDNVRLVKGFFSESLPGFLASHQGAVAAAHIDCDTYSSTVDILKNIKSRLQVGSWIVFDEIIGDMGLENEMKAVWDELTCAGFQFEWLAWGGHCWTAGTQAYFNRVKRPNPFYTLRLALKNPGSVISHLTNRKKVEEAMSAAVLRITACPR
jgi:Macrocin-O-methyltransferase (TylF)